MTEILIIDDEKPTLQMLSLFLQASGFTVWTAENEASGIDLFKRHRPAIVLTDIKMPGKDGFTVLRQVKALEPETDVIVVTGHGDKDLAQTALQMQATAFFNKPLDTDALETTLMRIVERRKDAGRGSR